MSREKFLLPQPSPSFRTMIFGSNSQSFFTWTTKQNSVVYRFLFPDLSKNQINQKKNKELVLATNLQGRPLPAIKWGEMGPHYK